jgi:muconate cycloisomerase
VESSLKIRGGEVFLVALPIRRPHHWVGHTARLGEGYAVLRLELESGVVGWGEAQVIGTWGGDHGARYGETPKMTATAIKEILLPAIAGSNVTEIEQLHARMNRALRGYPYAKAAIDVAVHDAIGKMYGVPVYQLLGGKVRDGTALAHSIGIMDADAAAHEAAEVIAEGITTIKVKIGVEAERDIKVVAAVRQAIGNAGKIRVDANQGYRTWRQAVRVIAAMEEYDLVYVEQPVEGLRAMAEVSARINVPVMADESAWTAEDVLEIVRLNAAQMLSVYYTKPGGLAHAKRLLAVAARHRCRATSTARRKWGSVSLLICISPCPRPRSCSPARSRSPRPPRRSSPRWLGTNISTISSKRRSASKTGCSTYRMDRAWASKSQNRA